MLEVFGFWMPGAQELLIVALVALILFGSRLPRLMKDMGRSFTSFKEGLNEPLEEGAEKESA